MQQTHNTPAFDFDTWAALARQDLQAFELKRTSAIEAVINSAPRRNRLRLRRLQWKLDRIRQTSATPLAACVRMNAMLWDSVAGEDGLLARLQQGPIPADRPCHSAKILPFIR
jgi:hypothetical protein